MATCAGCSADMDVDEFDVECGDQLSCPECGSNLEVIGLVPVELDLAREGVDTIKIESGSCGGKDDFD